MARTDTGSVGRQAEKFALDHLRDKGLEEIATNFRCRMGEIDLVMLDGDCLVFAEERFRNENSCRIEALGCFFVSRCLIVLIGH